MNRTAAAPGPTTASARGTALVRGTASVRKASSVRKAVSVRKAASVCVLALAATLAGCGAPKPVTFAPGTTMDRLHRSGRITIGVKADQPGLSFRNPATGQYEGFDIRMAQLVASALGLRPSQITFVETPSKDREAALIHHRVDIVVATYSITAQRQQEVGQAGPYYLTGQRFLVREADKDTITGPADLTGAMVCSVTGSTSIPWAEREFTNRLLELPTYTDCVRQLLKKTVRAVLTDGAVLLGYAAQQPNKLAVVGTPLSTERYGIGYPKGDLAFCQFLTDTITQAENDGAWAKALKDTLGRAGAPPPTRPAPDPCRP